MWQMRHGCLVANLFRRSFGFGLNKLHPTRTRFYKTLLSVKTNIQLKVCKPYSCDLLKRSFQVTARINSRFNLLPH